MMTYGWGHLRRTLWTAASALPQISSAGWLGAKSSVVAVELLRIPRTQLMTERNDRPTAIERRPPSFLRKAIRYLAPQKRGHGHVTG